MLPHIVVDSKVNKEQLFSGMDSIDQCPDPAWFNNYPHNISYLYNSRGFRDSEWPADLKNAIWCLGDSYTVGIGSPVEHTWPHILGVATGIRTINVSMDGASNDCIARFSAEIIQEVAPLAIIHQWSFTHRRELPHGTNEDRRLHFVNSTEQEDVDNLIAAIKTVESVNSATVLAHSFIPGFSSDSDKGHSLAIPAIQSLGLSNVVYFNDKLDLARDLLHYGVDTANKYVENYLLILKNNQLI